MHPKTTDNKYTELNDSKSITSIVLCHAHLLMDPQARIFHDPHSRAEHLPHSSLHYAVNLVCLEVGQRAAGRPRVGVRRAAQLEDEAQLQEGMGLRVRRGRQVRVKQRQKSWLTHQGGYREGE